MPRRAGRLEQGVDPFEVASQQCEMRRRWVEPEAHAPVLKALLDRSLLESLRLGIETELAARDGTREERPRIEHARRALVVRNGPLDSVLEPAHLVPVSERLLDEEEDAERVHLVVRAQP